jgi:hypothetical protein
MEKKEIQERNEAIAIFMGGKPKPEYNGWVYWQFFGSDGLIRREVRNDVILYNSAWNWLMPAVEKIEAEGNMVTINYFSDEKINSVLIYSPFGPNGLYFESEKESKIEAVFIAVSDFCLTQTKQHGKG